MKLRPSDLKSRKIKNFVIYQYGDFSFTYDTDKNKIVNDNNLHTIATDIKNKTEAKAAILVYLSEH